MKPVASRFQKVQLDSHELDQALQPSPYFWGYLQNKIAIYAEAVLDVQYSADNITAIIEHEKLKAQVEVLEELMRELTPPAEHVADSDSRSM